MKIEKKRHLDHTLVLASPDHYLGSLLEYDLHLVGLNKFCDQPQTERFVVNLFTRFK
jgi:hypothetical protein